MGTIETVATNEAPGGGGNDSGFTVHPKGISYAEAHLQPGARVLLLLAAVVSLAATAAMWAATNWLPLRLNLVWPALATLAFVAFGVLMAVLACIQPQVLVFDGTTLSVRGRALRRLGRSRELHLRFDSLEQPRVQAFERESQGPVHQVSIGVQGQPPLLLGAFDDTAHAQYWCDRLAPLLASTTASQQQ